MVKKKALQCVNDFHKLYLNHTGILLKELTFFLFPFSSPPLPPPSHFIFILELTFLMVKKIDRKSRIYSVSLFFFIF